MPFPCNFASHHCKIWHYNPAEEEEGVGSADTPAPVRKNGFHLDSKEPDWSKFRDFIMGEVRYCRRLRTPIKIKSNEVSNSLMKTFLTAFNFDNKVFGSPSGCPQEAEVPKAANTRKNRENVNEQLLLSSPRIS